MDDNGTYLGNIYGIYKECITNISIDIYDLSEKKPCESFVYVLFGRVLVTFLMRFFQRFFCNVCLRFPTFFWVLFQ